jgi:hypothetical protein
MPRHVARFSVALGTSAAVLLLLASCGSADASPGGAAGRASSHVEGTVVAGPQCPVARAERPCPPRPVPGARVKLLKGSHVIAQDVSDRHGNFRLRTLSGSYVVRATNVGAYRSTASKSVSLAHGATVTVRLVLDTGIR